MDPQATSFNKHPAPSDSESLPLFMSSPSDEPTDSPALSALQSLVHDGTTDSRFVPSRVPRRWCSHESVRKRSRRTSRNKETKISGESDTDAQGVDAKPNDTRLRGAPLMSSTACNLELRASRRPFLPCSSHLLSSLPTLVRPRHIIAQLSHCLCSSGRTRHWVCELVLVRVWWMTQGSRCCARVPRRGVRSWSRRRQTRKERVR